MYDVKVLTNIEEFEPLASEWESLKKAAGDQLLYSSHSWIMHFFQHHSKKTEPYIVLLYDKNELIGAAPLMRLDGTYTKISARRLEFISSSMIGDLSDFIVARDHEKVTSSIFDFLFSQHEDWDYAFFMLFLKDFTISKYYPQVFKRLNIHSKSKRGPDGYRMPVKGSWEEYYPTRSSNLKKMLNNRARRFEKAGGMNIEHYTKPDEVEKAISEVRFVHEKSWQGKDGCGVFSRRQNGFYEAFCEYAAEQGMMDIWVLKLEDKPISFEYSIVYNGVAHCLKWEFDGEYSKFSPGLTLRRHSLQ